MKTTAISGGKTITAKLQVIEMATNYNNLVQFYDFARKDCRCVFFCSVPIPSHLLKISNENFKMIEYFLRQPIKIYKRNCSPLSPANCSRCSINNPLIAFYEIDRNNGSCTIILFDPSTHNTHRTIIWTMMSKNQTG
jgi:hypothetical protein